MTRAAHLPTAPARIGAALLIGAGHVALLLVSWHAAPQPLRSEPARVSAARSSPVLYVTLNAALNAPLMARSAAPAPVRMPAVPHPVGLAAEGAAGAVAAQAVTGTARPLQPLLHTLLQPLLHSLLQPPLHSLLQPLRHSLLLPSSPGSEAQPLPPALADPVAVNASLPTPPAPSASPPSPVPAAPVWAAGAGPTAAAPDTRVAHADHRHCTASSYPAALRERGIEGAVTLRVLVDAQGHPADVQVLAGSGWRLFDDAALQRVRGCRFVPALRNGQAIDSWVEFLVRFALAG